MFLFQELSYDLAMTGSQGRLMLLYIIIPGRYLKGQVKTSTVTYSGLKQAYCSDRKDVLRMPVHSVHVHCLNDLLLHKYFLQTSVKHNFFLEDSKMFIYGRYK